MSDTSHTFFKVLAVAAGVVVATAAAQDFEIARSTIDGGGALYATGGDFELSGTVGQSDAGVMMTGQDFELTGGFWFRQSPGDCNYDSAVNLFDFDVFRDCMSGPGGGLTEPECVCFDFDHDTDVDMPDLQLFQRQFTGSQ